MTVSQAQIGVKKVILVLFLDIWTLNDPENSEISIKMATHPVNFLSLYVSVIHCVSFRNGRTNDCQVEFFDQ